MQTETWNADGPVHDVHYFDVAGHDFTDFDVAYGANGKQASAAYSNGMTESWAYNADNSLHSITYEGVIDTGYGTYTAGYAENRQNVVQEFGETNGTETVRGYADHLTFTSSAGGEAVSTASGQSFNFAANANATLTGGGQDETFVFRPGFGHDTIADFVPNAEPNASHDQIAFSPGTFANFADLMQHVSQAGTNTVIADAAGDSLVLQHVAAAHLTAADFHLV